jgi:hypothetical protein
MAVGEAPGCVCLAKGNWPLVALAHVCPMSAGHPKHTQVVVSLVAATSCVTYVQAGVLSTCCPAMITAKAFRSCQAAACNPGACCLAVFGNRLGCCCVAGVVVACRTRACNVWEGCSEVMGSKGGSCTGCESSGGFRGVSAVTPAGHGVACKHSCWHRLGGCYVA